MTESQRDAPLARALHANGAGTTTVTGRLSLPVQDPNPAIDMLPNQILKESAPAAEGPVHQIATVGGTLATGKDGTPLIIRKVLDLPVVTVRSTRKIRSTKRTKRRRKRADAPSKKRRSAKSKLASLRLECLHLLLTLESVRWARRTISIWLNTMTIKLKL